VGRGRRLAAYRSRGVRERVTGDGSGAAQNACFLCARGEEFAAAGLRNGPRLTRLREM
jgi:hypothetical protein